MGEASIGVLFSQWNNGITEQTSLKPFIQMQNMYYIHNYEYKDTIDRTIICLTFQQSVQKLSSIKVNCQNFLSRV